jgi:hypothetical protein
MGCGAKSWPSKGMPVLTTETSVSVAGRAKGEMEMMSDMVNLLMHIIA